MNDTGTLSERPVTVDDVDWIAALHDATHVRLFMPGATPEQIRGSIERGNTHERIVIDRDGRRLALWRAALEDSWVIYLKTLVVAEPGLGIGTRILEHMLHWSFSQNDVQRVYLNVVATNSIARRLYEKVGFVHEGTARMGFRTRDSGFQDLCSYAILRDEWRGAVSKQ
jgi:RimJ/RimL family protein N-acetyltransferase